MRRVLPFLTTLLLVFLALPEQAQSQEISVTGTWTLTYSRMGRQGGQARETSVEITLQQEGTAVTGTAAMQMRGRPGGGNPPAPQEIAISDGKFEDGTLTFGIAMGRGDRTFTQTFTTTEVTATTMEGTLSGGMRATDPIPFKGVKKEG